MSKFFTCKDCPDRYIGCHAKCEKYLREKADYECLKAIANQDKSSKNYTAEAISRRQSIAAVRRKKSSQYNRKHWD